MDKLDELFDLQRNAQLAYGTLPFKDEADRQRYINIMSLALIDETMEALRETPWKPWKKNQEMHEEDFKAEIIDAWHFIINLSIAAGMTSSDLHDSFVAKNKINMKRRQEGY